jgi:hypothetical protein
VYMRARVVGFEANVVVAQCILKSILSVRGTGYILESYVGSKHGTSSTH